LIVGILIIGSSVWPASRLGSEFMPTLDEGTLLYMPSARPGISPGKARQVLQQTDKLIMTVPEVKSAFGKMGRAQTATDNAPLTMVGTVIQFKPKSEWPPGVTEAEVRRELKERVKLPGLTNAWVYPIQTRINMISTGIKTPVGIKVSGPDLAVIQKIGKKLEKILPAVKGTTSVFSDRAVGGRYIQINIDRDKAARLGLNISNVEAVVQSAVGGMNVTETVEGLARYPVNIRYPRAWRNSLARLRQLPIVTARGAHITLGDVASVRITNGPPMIKSEQARLTGWTYVDIAGRDLGSWVAAAKRLVARKIKLPQGYTLAWSGQYQFLQRAMQSLKLVAPLVIALVALLLYLAFRSVPLMFIILGTLPMAFAGGVWLLYFLQYNLSVAVAVGFIALAGLTVEIGVVLVVYLNQSVAAYLERCKRESQPLRFEGVRDAVRDGALLRLRPISMTVAAIIVGLLPIMLGSGTGASLTRHIAAPMIGGIVSSLVLTMLVLPAVYLLWKWGNVKKVSG
jgi:Cu(I)/Ag(I) efflux system membrane protein CusA/SilA